MPSRLIAQSALSPTNATSVQECGYPSNDLAFGVAKTQPDTVKPSASSESLVRTAAISEEGFSKLALMRLVQASNRARSLTDQPDVLPRWSSTTGEECFNRDNSRSRAKIAGKPEVSDSIILGSVSVPVTHTPFDLKWSAVNAKRSHVRFDRQLASTGARKLRNQKEQVEAINRWVNRKIILGSDRDIYGRTDHWAPAAETFRRGTGDCEDIAIAKMELLAALGISRDNIRLVVARDLVRNSDHALLMVELSGGSVMLDNMTDQLLDARIANDYSPILSFNRRAKWVHGYADQTSIQPRITSVDHDDPNMTSNLSEVSTVTAEPEMPTVSLTVLSIPLAFPNVLLAKT